MMKYSICAKCINLKYYCYRSSELNSSNTFSVIIPQNINTIKLLNPIGNSFCSYSKKKIYILYRFLQYSHRIAKMIL